MGGSAPTVSGDWERPTLRGSTLAGRLNSIGVADWPFGLRRWIAEAARLLARAPGVRIG
jgi:hypothetical protein